jgi:hypothetical protein
MPSVDEAVESLVAADKPVLFLDTCVLLDIIRSTQRCLKDYAARASELLTLISDSPPACALILSSIVPQEWADNAPTVMDETSRHLRSMEEQSAHFHAACQALGLAMPAPRTQYGQSGLAEALRDLSRSLVDHAVILDEQTDSRIKAFNRVVNRIPPAMRKGEVKDCAIIEEYLAVCRGLQAAGFMRKRVFCTSNTEDYCEAGGVLHSHLAIEFAGCALSFTKNLPWALHEITH